MILNQTPAKIYDAIFFFIEYFNPNEIENKFTGVYDDTSFMLSCYEQVKAEIGNIPEYLSPLFLYRNSIASPISQFHSDNFDFHSDNIDSFIVKLITNSEKLRTKTYELIFGSPEAGNCIDAIENLDAPLEYKLQISLLLGDFNHAIRTLTTILKQVYLGIEKLNKKYEREIISRLGQIQSDTNIRAYEIFLKYDRSRFNSTEISISLLNQYIVNYDDNGKMFFMMLGYKHEESLGEESEHEDIINVEQFILCCGNELRLRMIKVFCEYEELTSSQIAQIIECPVTTTIRHINMLADNHLIFISKREGLQIFYKLNIKLFKKMQGKICNLFDNIFKRSHTMKGII